MGHHYKLVTTTDGNLYFGEYSTKDGIIVLTECCMLYMYGMQKPTLNIARFGFVTDDNANVTSCISSVSIFNPSLCIDVSDHAVASILDLIMKKANRDIADKINDEQDSKEKEDAFSMSPVAITDYVMKKLRQ